MTLERGQLIPHFAVTTIDGDRFEYADIWQRRNLLLIALPAAVSSDAADRYLTDLTSRSEELEAFETTCVITFDRVPGVVAPAVVITDRWGEVYATTAVATIAALPSADAIFEWLRYINHECPECQGEVR